MPRNLVLFDLEWNIGYQPYTFNYHGVQQTFRGEIVEIGAVKIDEDANVLDTFSIHLRPRIFRKLQHHIAKVTGLTQADLDKGEPIVQGLRRFMQWCGPDAEFAEWGMDDVPVLKQNLFLCNIDESRPTVWYDLQQVFLREHPRKEGEGMTLESVVTRMGIPMERQFHDALSDTLYTADVCRLLDLRAGLAAAITKVISNLMTNALKYTEDYVRLSCRLLEDGNHKAAGFPGRRGCRLHHRAGVRCQRGSCDLMCRNNNQNFPRSKKERAKWT